MFARLVSVCLLSLVFLVPGAVGAQQTSNLQQVITVKVRPATNAQFEEYVRAVRQASQKQGLKNYWLISQSVSGEPTYTVNLARQGGWPDVGSAGPDLVKVFGEKEAARLTGLAQNSIEGMSTAFYQTQVDMSVPPPQPMKTPPVAVRYFFLTLKPGMGQQYAEGSRKTREASLAVMPNSYYVVQTPSVGATAVRVIGILQSWAEVDNTPGPQERVIKHFGPEQGGKIATMVADTISDIRVQIDRTRPDLNYQPAN